MRILYVDAAQSLSSYAVRASLTKCWIGDSEPVVGGQLASFPETISVPAWPSVAPLLSVSDEEQRTNVSDDDARKPTQHNKQTLEYDTDDDNGRVKESGISQDSGTFDRAIRPAKKCIDPPYSVSSLCRGQQHPSGTAKASA